MHSFDLQTQTKMTHSDATTLNSPQSINLTSFKTQKCAQTHHRLYFPYYFDCPNYHSPKDKRRNPFSPNPSSNTYLYNSIYTAENVNEQQCMSWTEYLYHPCVYKTEKCANQDCHRVYCPKTHPNQCIKPQVNPCNPVVQAQSAFIAELNEKFASLVQMKSASFAQLQNPLIVKSKQKIMKIKQQYDQREQSKQQTENCLQKQLHQLSGIARLESLDASRLNSSQPGEQSRLSYLTDAEDIVRYRQYQQGERLDIIEGRHHQFKMFKNKETKYVVNMVLEYMSAFMNSEGGTMYLGVNDDSQVFGIEVSQKWIDQFLLGIDQQGKTQLNPPLIPQKYNLTVVPVRNRRNRWLNVIEIEILPQPKRDKKVLTLFNRECYLRMNASNHRLSASEIIEYMRLNNTAKVLEILEHHYQQIEHMGLKQLQQLQSNLTKLSNKVSQNIRRKEKEKEQKNEGVMQ